MISQYIYFMLIALLSGLWPVSMSANDNWPQFRGLTAGSIKDNTELPESWSTNNNIAWELNLPGLGWSSPIVWDDFIFITAVVSDELAPTPGLDLIEDGKMPGYAGGPTSQEPKKSPYHWILYAIDFNNGEVLWTQKLHTATPSASKHPKNTYASETPVTDGERIYVYHASAGLFAVDFNGEIVWSRNVKLPETINPASEDKLSPKPSLDLVQDSNNNPETRSTGSLDGLGAAASPTLYDGHIYISADYESRTWFLAGFDAQTGKNLWNVSHAKPTAAYGWSTPFVWKNELRTELITAGDLRVRSYDLKGNSLWTLEGLSVNTTPTPFAAHGLLYIASGLPADTLRPIYAIRPGAMGDISLNKGEKDNEYIAWYQESAAPYMPSPLVHGDYLYTLYSQGFLTCHNAKTGELIYGRQRIARGASGFTASPWAYNDKIFAASEDGDTYVIKAGPNYQLLGKNSLNEMLIATPAIVRNSVIIRTVSKLYRITKTP